MAPARDDKILIVIQIHDFLKGFFFKAVNGKLVYLVDDWFYHCTHKQYWRCWVLAEVLSLVLLFHFLSHC